MVVEIVVPGITVLFTKYVLSSKSAHDVMYSIQLNIIMFGEDLVSLLLVSNPLSVFV